MSDWTSVSVKQQTRERLNRMKQDVAESQELPEQSSDEFLNNLMDTWEAQSDGPESEVTAKVNVDTDEAMKQLDEIEERIKDMDVVSNNQRVLTRIDDLETELKTHFERELGR